MKTIVNAATKNGLVAVDGEHIELAASLPAADPASCPPLQALVSRLRLEHPHFPVPYGTADPTFCGRGGGGRDWKPVPRELRSSAEGLSMTALLSQALVAFAIEYEQQRRGPIQWAALGGRHPVVRQGSDPALLNLHVDQQDDYRSDDRSDPA